MEVSEELQKLAIEAFEKVAENALQNMRQQKWTSSIVQCSFLFNGVIDYATYNVKEDRFESITIKIAKSGINRMWSGAPAKLGERVYADECEYVVIPIPQKMIV